MPSPIDVRQNAFVPAFDQLLGYRKSPTVAEIRFRPRTRVVDAAEVHRDSVDAHDHVMALEAEVPRPHVDDPTCMPSKIDCGFGNRTLSRRRSLSSATRVAYFSRTGSLLPTLPRGTPPGEARIARRTELLFSCFCFFVALGGIAAGLPRPPLAFGLETTFPLHEASPLWFLHSGRRVLENYVYVSSITAERRPNTRRPVNRTSPICCESPGRPTPRGARGGHDTHGAGADGMGRAVCGDCARCGRLPRWRARLRRPSGPATRPPSSRSRCRRRVVRGCRLAQLGDPPRLPGARLRDARSGVPTQKVQDSPAGGG